MIFKIALAPLPETVKSFTKSKLVTLSSKILAILSPLFTSAPDGNFATTANLPSSTVGINLPPNLLPTYNEPKKSTIIITTTIPLLLTAHLSSTTYHFLKDFKNLPSELRFLFSFIILLDIIGTKVSDITREANNEYEIA